MKTMQHPELNKTMPGTYRCCVLTLQCLYPLLPH
uniref:Uncharacterized protein n=1 Tax=Anguilla anguilla TaxID=7936 RepID=A0A0E9XCF0_ANGAN